MIDLIVTLSEGHRAKLTPPKYCQLPLCNMSEIHTKAVNRMAQEIFDETVVSDLIVTLSEGHRAKITPPVDCKPPFCYMSVIHLKGVTI